MSWANIWHMAWLGLADCDFVASVSWPVHTEVTILTTITMTTMPCQQHCHACTTTLTLPTAQCETMRAVTACHVLVSVPHSMCHNDSSTVAMPVPCATTALPPPLLCWHHHHHHYYNTTRHVCIQQHNSINSITVPMPPPWCDVLHTCMMIITVLSCSWIMVQVGRTGISEELDT